MNSENLFQKTGSIGSALTFAFLLFFGIAGAVEQTANADSAKPLAGKMISWVVPNKPGGGYDQYSRLIAPFYGLSLEADVVVTNLPGAGGLIGAQEIQRAPSDGTTVGIINGAGFLAASLVNPGQYPHPATDFTILGRIVGDRLVLAVGSQSPFRSMESLFDENRKRPIIFGTRDLGSLSFVNITVLCDLLGIDGEMVAGYSGSRAGAMAALRGEVDVVCYTFFSILDQVEEGLLIPLLQISDSPIAQHPSLNKTDILGGPDGVAAKRAVELGKNIEEVTSDANALIELNNTGRLVVAPKNMGSFLRDYMENALHKTLTAAPFVEEAKKANRPLDVERGTVVHQKIEKTRPNLERFSNTLKVAFEKLRQ